METTCAAKILYQMTKNPSLEYMTESMAIIVKQAETMAIC